MMNSRNETIKCDECGQTIGTGEVFDCEDCFVDYYWQCSNAEQYVFED